MGNQKNRIRHYCTKHWLCPIVKAMEHRSPSADSITFLGTAGARFTVTTQLLASGGMWLSLGGTEILVDPGPGCIVHSTRRKLKPENLSAIILSHRHLDHSGDANIMIEAMTRGGLKRHGWLFAPADALRPEPVVFSYLRGYLEGVEVLEEGRSYSVGGVSFTTPLRHVHPAETYGVVFNTAHPFSYIADSRYFDGLCCSYSGELLIINVVRLKSGHPYDHLSADDAAHIIKEIKPRVAILTHFGMTMWQAKPWQVAEKMSLETCVKVIAARDGMRFDFSELD